MTIPLTVFLDAGCDLRSIDDWQGLAEEIVVYGRTLPPSKRHDAAATRRRQAARFLDDDERFQAMGRDMLWAAECLEDENLALRFEAALPPDLLAQLLAAVEALRHPHRLLIEDMASFVCSSCGDEHRGPAVSVDDSNGIVFCADCITVAVAALGEAL